MGDFALAVGLAVSFAKKHGREVGRVLGAHAVAFQELRRPRDDQGKFLHEFLRGMQEVDGVHRSQDRRDGARLFEGDRHGGEKRLIEIRRAKLFAPGGDVVETAALTLEFHADESLFKHQHGVGLGDKDARAEVSAVRLANEHFGSLLGEEGNEAPRRVVRFGQFIGVEEDRMHGHAGTGRAFAAKESRGDEGKRAEKAHALDVQGFDKRGGGLRQGLRFHLGDTAARFEKGRAFLKSGGTVDFAAPDGKTWMKQNLAYDGEDPDNKVGAPFQDSEAMSDVFGRFYTWEEALGIEPGETPAGGNVQGICPDGWHIPSDEEWTALANATMVYAGYDGWTPIDSSANWAADGYKVSREFMAGEILRDDIQESDDDYDSDIEYGKEARSATFNTDTELWQYVNAVGDPTNRSGISAIPVGYARRTNGMWSFYGNYEYAIFWTSSYDPESGKAICRVINNESPDVYMESHDRSSFAASVRCVKD